MYILGLIHVYVHIYIGIQGNMDPMVLFAPQDVIKSRVEEILKAGVYVFMFIHFTCINMCIKGLR